MGVFADVEAFVQEHRGCGPLEGDAGEPGPLGHRVAIRCPSGARLDRWVTVEMAERELRGIGTE